MAKKKEEPETAEAVETAEVAAVEETPTEEPMSRIDVLKVLARTRGEDITEEIEGKTVTVHQDGSVTEIEPAAEPPTEPEPEE